MYGLDDLTDEQLQKSLKDVLVLEFIGIRIENQKEIDGVMHHMFSVPESSTYINKDCDEEFNKEAQTSDGLIQIAKYGLTRIITEIYENMSKNDIWIEEFVKDFKENTSDYIKFYAKVRTGDVWSEEKGKKRMEELNKQLEFLRGYKEV